MSKSFAPHSGSNETIEWYTPPEIFTALNTTFDLDPASPGQDKCHVPAQTHYTYHDNGLALPWSGLVWLNPPYGSNTKKWLLKLLRHSRTDEGGIALVFARTDNEWFQAICSQSTSVTFLSSRVKFIRPDTTQADSPASGSMLVAFGSRGHAIVTAAQPNLGVTFRPEPSCIDCSGPYDCDLHS